MIGGKSCAFFEGSCEDVGCRSCSEVKKARRVWMAPRAVGKTHFVTEEQAASVPHLDNVQHPPHYARWKMEPIEFIAINNLPWWLANVIKYTMRYDFKDGLQDLYKARSYLEMKIREVEGEKRFWDKPVAQERTLNEGA